MKRKPAIASSRQAVTSTDGKFSLTVTPAANGACVTRRFAGGQGRTDLVLLITSLSGFDQLRDSDPLRYTYPHEFKRARDLVGTILPRP